MAARDNYDVHVFRAPLKPSEHAPYGGLPGRVGEQAAHRAETESKWNSGFGETVGDAVLPWLENVASPGDYIVIATDGDFGVQGIFAITVEERPPVRPTTKNIVKSTGGSNELPF